MPLMSTCLGRLGSRFSIIFDPIRKQIHYGSLGLMCQSIGEMVVALDDGAGNVSALPLSAVGEPMFNTDQRQTMTSLVFEGHSIKLGASLELRIVAPFWPRDAKTSLAPAYILQFRVSHLPGMRWVSPDPQAPRKGWLRFAIRIPDAQVDTTREGVRLRYAVRVPSRVRTGEGGRQIELPAQSRQAVQEGQSTDLIVPLSGKWKVDGGGLAAEFDVSNMEAAQEFTLAVVSYCPDALFERLGHGMWLKYTDLWPSVQAVVSFVKGHRDELLGKSRRFDEIWTDSSLPAAMQDLSALSFQSYLMNTMWTVGQDKAEWFSVWEGSCSYNSTVDVTYNEAMFYFACWPELLEMIFEQWSRHVNDAEAELTRCESASGDYLAKLHLAGELDFLGAILEHDMGSAWTANGQSYHHAMPVEENSNFLLLLYAHGKWWGRGKTLFRKYKTLNKKLVEYLLWTDSTGNGFPDRGVANTIDDATPAVQYGRDNVYLGVKRLAALHAAGRMLDAVGEKKLAERCRQAVRKAVGTFNAGWLGDHWGVCLDRFAEGLIDSWSGRPLTYHILPGWDAYSLYTTNGLMYLLMINDLPPGLDADQLRQDTVNAMRESMTPYGCSHSSADRRNMWISMNIWRDCAGGYLGENLLTNCERYWAWQLACNGPGAEKANCFTETSLTNNLVWYPRGAATFGLTMAATRLVMDRSAGKATVKPLSNGRWPLLPLMPWSRKNIPPMPAVVQETQAGKPVVRLENIPATKTLKVGTRK